MKITIAGAGAMGCRFGGALFAAGHEVLLLDGWPEHVCAINAGGLRIDDSRGSAVLRVPAQAFSAAPAAADLVIVFTKATATAAAATAAAGAIGPGTLVLTLQNGLGNIEALQSCVPAARLLAGHHHARHRTARTRAHPRAGVRRNGARRARPALRAIMPNAAEPYSSRSRRPADLGSGRPERAGLSSGRRSPSTA